MTGKQHPVTGEHVKAARGNPGNPLSREELEALPDAGRLVTLAAP